MSYTWLLFDADDTLFDYDAAENRALRATFADFDLTFDPTVHEIYRRVNRQMWLDFEEGKTTAARIKTERFAQLFAVLRDAAHPISAAPDPLPFSTAYLNHLGTCTDLMPDARVVLERLRSRVHLALITNGLTVVQRARLSLSGLGDFFEAIVISDEEGVSKPDPRIFEIALERMGNPAKDEVLMVGDSLTSDIRGANAFGIDACWYNPHGKPTPPGVNIEVEIGALRELLTLVNGYEDLQ